MPRDEGASIGDVRFPVALLSHDSVELVVYGTLGDLEDAVESPDVENGEYTGWDAEHYRVLLSVAEGRAERKLLWGVIRLVNRTPGWLVISRLGEMPESAEFEGAIDNIALHAGLECFRKSGESIMAYAERVESLMYGP